MEKSNPQELAALFLSFNVKKKYNVDSLKMNIPNKLIYPSLNNLNSKIQNFEVS